MLSELAELASASTIDATVRLARARPGGKPAPSATADRGEAGNAVLTVLRDGRPPVRGETPIPRWLDAQRNDPARRSGHAPKPTETWHRLPHRIGDKRRLQHTLPFHTNGEIDHMLRVREKYG